MGAAGLASRPRNQSKFMRQAIIIKNPKWEPFTKASDAFKSTTVKDGESCLLVVRGRCKEKNMKTSKPLASGKTAEWLKTQAKEVVAKLAKATALFVCLFAFSAAAQQSIVPLFPATYIAGLTTNATSGSGQIGWNIDQTAVFQFSITGTNAGAVTPIQVRFDTSNDGTYWVATAYTLNATTAGAATSTSLVRATNTVGGKWIRIGGVANTNAATGGITITAASVTMREQ